MNEHAEDDEYSDSNKAREKMSRLMKERRAKMLKNRANAA